LQLVLVSTFLDSNPVDIQLDIPLLGQFKIYFFVPDICCSRESLDPSVVSDMSELPAHSHQQARTVAVDKYCLVIRANSATLLSPMHLLLRWSRSLLSLTLKLPICRRYCTREKGPSVVSDMSELPAHSHQQARTVAVDKYCLVTMHLLLRWSRSLLSLTLKLPICRRYCTLVGGLCMSNIVDIQSPPTSVQYLRQIGNFKVRLSRLRDHRKSNSYGPCLLV
jgi:hypothetical protein